MLPKLLLFLLLLITHTITISSRKPLQATLPFMMEDVALVGFNKENAGILTSVFAGFQTACLIF